MEGRQGRKLHGIWMSCSLERKVRWITISTAAVVILSITAVMLVAGYGMKGFGDLLMGNSRSLAFWSAMDAESSSFQYYAGDRTPENREKYEMSCARTRSALKSLPFDYEEIGADRYGVTWSILNMYENYAAARDAFLEMEEGAPDYLDRLYTIYRVQGYLATHAGRLEQMTVESGNERYEMQRPLFIIVPAVSILWGAAALLMVRWLNRSVQRNIVRPMVELAEDSRRIGENDFTGPDTHAEGGDEIASLVRAFCTMKASTRGYIEALTEKHKMEKQLDEVRLQMLKNQINPHFLFNTLNMIASTAQIEDAATTEKMIHALSRLFRYNLKSTDSVMPLERELKVVQDYMYLQQMRFGQRIRYDTDCNQDTLEVLVPSFALQPWWKMPSSTVFPPKGRGEGYMSVPGWREGGSGYRWLIQGGNGPGTAGGNTPRPGKG
ncbi:integral membrane sensor signal transduction histidine kinase [Enterocloster clostridioformis]|uniref:Integral membrane sensor signal transduction histidine kinase n=1 Tax=Enterocloster clostridioformis TaxID=1531 RepID=A0A2X2UCW0_9FIRM|nr:histidine kinase [Enterocloster clostridioformis]SQB14224.1 integral membrane sensor signal transduction histidine kinase [Enterocloster clostridioformis]